jgi:hypothetical protein
MEHKHHSVSRSASGTGSGRIGAVVFVIASIVLIAGIIALSPLGSYLSEHVITPLLSCVHETTDDTSIVSALKQQEERQSSASPEPKPSEQSHEVIVIEEVPFYILQMGTFTKEDAAGEHADEIRRMGAGGTLFHDGSVFRVFAAAYTDESSLIKVQSQVRSDGFEATPYITESNALKITLNGDKKAVDVVTKAVKTLNGIPSELCAVCLSFDKGELNDADLRKELQAKQNLCTESLKEMEQINTADLAVVKDLLQKYVKNISTFLGEHDTMNTEMISGELKHLQLSVIIDYILFFDRK